MVPMTAAIRHNFYPIPYVFSNCKSSRIQSSSVSFNFTAQKIKRLRFEAVKASESELLELNTENVDKVLDNVRPYLIADGGNVDVVAVDNGVVSLKLQGACGSCPSSTTTMKMGIERVLKEKFGDAIKDVSQVDDGNNLIQQDTTVDAVNTHLDILRPAINNYGGRVHVLSVTGEDCLVEYVGPDSIGSGIKAAIKERFPDIVNVQFTN